ncbi:hypothetical protein BH24ACI4_BH24ACI4_32040 [soil metagenome]
MGLGGWMRVIDSVSGLVEMSGKFRRPPEGDDPASAAGAAGGGLETRLAGIVVAALQEAFDRDRARLDLERSQIEAERQRAEEALKVEIRRQAAERSLGQLRFIAIAAGAVWMLSAALGVWLPHMRSPAPLVLMGTGWAASIAALGCALVAWQQVSNWSAGIGEPVTANPLSAPGSAAPWLLLASVALTGAALLLAL